MLAKLAYRAATELSPRLAAKAAHLWVYKGMLAVRSYQARISRKELYPPFMFVALTNTCNLRCHGCWVEKEGEAFHMQADELDNIIRSVLAHVACKWDRYASTSTRWLGALVHWISYNHPAP